MSEKENKSSTKKAKASSLKPQSNKGNTEEVNLEGTSDKEKFLLGGEISFECPEHRRHEVYCVCQKVDYTEEEEMV